MRGRYRAFIIFRTPFRLYILRCSAEFPAHRFFAHCDKFCILALLFEKLFMRALFDNLAAVEYDNFVCVAHCL